MFEVLINARGEGDYIGVGKLEGDEGEIDNAIDLIKDFCINHQDIAPLIADMSGGPVKRPNQLPPWL